MFRGLIRGNTNVLFVQRHPGVADFASFPAFLCDLAVAIHGVLAEIVDIAVARVPSLKKKENLIFLI